MYYFNLLCGIVFWALAAYGAAVLLSHVASAVTAVCMVAYGVVRERRLAKELEALHARKTAEEAAEAERLRAEIRRDFRKSRWYERQLKKI